MQTMKKITADLQRQVTTSHCQQIDWKKIDPKTLITDLDKDTLTHNPNRPKYFSMQTVNNPSKRDSRAFKKAQVVIT